MAYHDMNLYALGLDRRPSSRQTERQHASPIQSPSIRGASGMGNLNYSSSGHRRMTSNRQFIQSPENATYEDGATPQVISPQVEADVNNMLSQASYAEHPRADTILSSHSHHHVPDRPLTLAMGYSSPWSGLRTEEDYRALVAETSDEMFQTMIDQSMLLNVPSNPRSRGTGGTRRSFSTVHSSYTTSSDDRSDMNHEQIETRRGGREQGAGCRCMYQVQDVENEDILAERLHFHNMAGWISEHTHFPPGQENFELPLYFGFGKIFKGLYAIEYDPTTNEAQRSHAVGHGNQLRIDQGIHVCPVYNSAEEAQRMIWDWLKQTLTSARSMREWLKRCFPDDEIEWIQKLLLSTWEYSIKCWQESRNSQVEEAELDHNLLEAWMAALLVTMLSLPVTIPEQVVHNIVPRLRFRNYNYPLPNSSRALTRCVKALLFDMYRKFVDRLTSALRDFEKLKLEGVSDRRLGHIYCIAILVMVITCHIQTSLMDNGWLSSRQLGVDPNLWEETFERIRDVECAFRNTIMFVKHNNKKWLRKNQISDAKLLVLRQDIREIERTYHDAIERHRNVDLEKLMKSSDPFHGFNMQRVFDFYLEQLVRKETSTGAE
uniref:Nitrate transporter 1.8 n=1 Tax=Talaromyces marneffei PM1 TaxID=1077442 RepID=A0A093Y3R0_TALMA